MADEFTNRRGVMKPDYEFTLECVGVRIPNGMVHWWISEESVYSEEELADLLELVVDVLRQQPENGSDNESSTG